MPAAVVKGIIISISIITALGIAVLENPQIQHWLEEQRQRLIQLLRSIREDLDPETRRAAEAFAFEGRTPANDAGLRREMSGSRDAVALATGRSLPVRTDSLAHGVAGPSGAAVRRIPVRGPGDEADAEERRRQGREYLAKRRAQMFELQRRRDSAKADGAATPPSPASFDEMVDGDGKLKEGTDPEKMRELLPSPPAIDPVPDSNRHEMREVERTLVQPLLAGEESSSSGFSGFRLGSQLADPFSDDFALDRSETPRPPPGPPKIAEQEPEMAHVPPMPVPEIEMTDPTPLTMPGSFEQRRDTPRPLDPQRDHSELTYEEQLAIALSLSEAESMANAASAATVRRRQPEEDDADLKAAIAASLRDMGDQQAAHAIAHAEPVTPQPIPEIIAPLVDLTPPSPRVAPVENEARQARSDWEALFDHHFSPSQEPLTAHSEAVPERAPSEAPSEELYRVTPKLTRARLASWDAQLQQQQQQEDDDPPISVPSVAYDPVREAAESNTPHQQQMGMESSFYSAPSSVTAPPASERSETLSQEPQLINIEEAREGAQTPTTHTFRSDSSDSDTFASLSRPQSRARSEISHIEVIDVAEGEDSDVDMLSGEEGDGIATPDSWTEVGSRDGETESEVSEDERQRVRNVLVL